MINILICGYGNIGRHLERELAPLVRKKLAKIYIYDRYDAAVTTGQPDNYYDFAFVCVPTDMLSDGSADTSEVDYIVSKLKSSHTDVIVIKSSVPVKTCENYRNHNIVMSPEYYGTTQHAPKSSSFLVIGGNQDFGDINDAMGKLAQLYYKFKRANFKIFYTGYREAELAKYMENCWLATKVTFCNEFASVAENLGVEYDILRQIFISDSRVNPSHTIVYKDNPYYDSHCLNKDIPAHIQNCEKMGIKVPFMKAVDKINKARKSKFKK